ncbi:MAG TPA: hypothetical protein VI076_17465, partial [Actinopolymorphaceae bacterium]
MASPTLLAAAGFVAYACLRGDILLLQIAAAGALVAGVAGVVLFDAELIRTRRDHGADRASLAKSYAETYAAHIRVTSVVTEKAEAPEPVAESAAATSESTTSTAPATAAATARPMVDETPLVTPLVAGAAEAEAPELWDHLGDA